MVTMTFDIPGRPVPQPRHRATRAGRMYLPSGAPVRAFKAAIQKAVKSRIRKPLECPVMVEISAQFRRPPSHPPLRFPDGIGGSARLPKLESSTRTGPRQAGNGPCAQAHRPRALKRTSRVRSSAPEERRGEKKILLLRVRLRHGRSSGRSGTPAPGGPGSPPRHRKASGTTGRRPRSGTTRPWRPSGGSGSAGSSPSR